VRSADLNTSLDLHVETSGDSGTLQGLVGAVLLTDSHESGHLVLSELDFLSAEGGEGDVGDFVVGLGMSVRCDRHEERARRWGRKVTPQQISRWLSRGSKPYGLKGRSNQSC
jgi:hypothetical protein